MELFVKILFALPVYQSVILTLLLFFSSNRRLSSSRIIMGSFQFLMAFYFTFNFLYSIRAFEVVASIYFLILPVILLFIPVFYLYILSITTPGFMFKKSYLFHFIPAFSILCLNLPYLFASVAERTDFISNGYNMVSSKLFSYLLSVYMVGIFGIFTLQLLYYAIRSVKLYRNHKMYIESRFSYTENINLDWILVLIISFVIFFVFNDLLYFVGFRQHFITQIIYNIAMLIITFYSGYRGLLQVNLNEMISVQNLLVFSGQDDCQASDKADSVLLPLVSQTTNTESKGSQFTNKTESIKKYSGSALSGDQKKILLSKLDQLVIHEKIFINDKLSIEDIAVKLDTNTKYISQLINETYNKNFYNFINFYRIEEAKRLLISEENEKYSILGIAQSVGFVSKSTFNVAFKRYTGVTPTEFKTKATECKNLN